MISSLVVLTREIMLALKVVNVVECRDETCDFVGYSREPKTEPKIS
ncbi:MAG: hypothetical protein O8C66_01895 [Candidatus Methanoperedens sp.]|nr:hypothetical protein [Candidatus Methanoperedens sp.]MCZ7369237.1 hypothetical protein [Candidatus Methanoperedens sp.]